MAFTIPDDKKDGFIENHPFIALFGSLALIPALWAILIGGWSIFPMK